MRRGQLFPSLSKHVRSRRQKGGAIHWPRSVMWPVKYAIRLAGVYLCLWLDLKRSFELASS